MKSMTATGAALWFALTSAATAAPQPSPEPTAAYMFLEIPTTAGHAATERPLLAFSYDAQAGVPLERRGSTTSEEGDVRATLTLAATSERAPLVAKAPYDSIEVLETDSARNPTQRITFHDVKIGTIEPAGDEPAVRITFTARTVTIH